MMTTMESCGTEERAPPVADHHQGEGKEAWPASRAAVIPRACPEECMYEHRYHKATGEEDITPKKHWQKKPRSEVLC